MTLSREPLTETMDDAGRSQDSNLAESAPATMRNSAATQIADSDGAVPRLLLRLGGRLLKRLTHDVRPVPALHTAGCPAL